jgi:hypothetical protein
VHVNRVFTDKASGKDVQRPQLDQLLTFARDGDTVVVHSMDRLARNLDDLRKLVQTFTQRGVRIEFVKEHLIFTGEDSPIAQLMLSVMGAFAEFERALIRERQREGIALAKQRGVYRGRKKSLHPDQVHELRQRAFAGEATTQEGGLVRALHWLGTQSGARGALVTVPEDFPWAWIPDRWWRWVTGQTRQEVPPRRVQRQALEAVLADIDQCDLGEGLPPWIVEINQ